MPHYISPYLAISRPEIEQLLRAAARPLPPRNGVEPTRLFPTNDECDGVNASKLSALPGGLTTVAAHDVVEVSAELGSNPNPHPHPNLVEVSAELGSNPNPTPNPNPSPSPNPNRVEVSAECPKVADARRAHGAQSAEVAAAEEEVRPNPNPNP